MKNPIEKALQGKKSALEYLYNTYSPKVFGLSYYILQNEADAKRTTENVFLNIFDELGNGNLITEEEFCRMTLTKAAGNLRKQLIKVNKNAFKIPTDKNFLCKYSHKDKENGALTSDVLGELNELNRFAVVLSVYGGFNEVCLSEASKLDLKTLQSLLKACRTNTEEILKADFPDADYEAFSAALEKGEALPEQIADIPLSVQEKIDAMAAPKLKALKKKIIIYTATGFSILVLFALGGWLVTSFGGENDDMPPVSSEVEGVEIKSWATKVAETTYFADIEIKNYGKITVALDGKTAPKTVNNFVSLAKSGFYDGLTFHRIIDTFMMQGGDPDATGTGGNKDKNGNEINIEGEFAANGFNNNLAHTAGAISMARSDDYNSASSQFFICHKDSRDLDGQYAAFGYVTEGMDVVDAVCSTDYDTPGGATIPKEKQPVITKITIRNPQ